MPAQFKMKHLFQCFFVIAATNLPAQSCYETALQKGQAAYDKGDYPNAAKYWRDGKSCEGADAQILIDLIWKTGDNDGDGFVNGQDKCPYAFGQKKNSSGCPDGKSVAKKEDKSTEKVGEEYLEVKEGEHLEVTYSAPVKRKPDMDDDGVLDRNDECPKQKGTLANQGCPEVPPMPVMVFVRGGAYSMGDQFAEGNADEAPTHRVTLNDFYIGKYEVTFGEYDAFCTATGRKKPYDNGWGRGRNPVINVDWYDAVEYCNWCSQKENLSLAYTIDKTLQDTNNVNTAYNKMPLHWTVSINWDAKGYRLPTEAEWEYAARAVASDSGKVRGGGKVRFGNGRDIIDPSEINFNATDTLKKDYSVVGKYREETVPVDDLSANGFGLKHMSGNVWEWCGDWYAEKYYSESDRKRNPLGATSGQYRVLRGGSWAFIPENCRLALRGWDDPRFYDNLIGFRMVRGH